MCLWFCFTECLEGSVALRRSARATTQSLKLPFAALYAQSRDMLDTTTDLASKNGGIIMTTSNWDEKAETKSGDLHLSHRIKREATGRQRAEPDLFIITKPVHADITDSQAKQ